MAFRQIYSFTIKENYRTKKLLRVVMNWPEEDINEKHFFISFETSIRGKDDVFRPKKNSCITMKFDDFKDIFCYMVSGENGIVNERLGQYRIRYDPKKVKNYFSMMFFRWYEPGEQTIIFHKTEINVIISRYDAIVNCIEIEKNYK